MFGKPTLKLKTASGDKFKQGAKFIDEAILPTIQSIVEKANEQLKKHGLVVAADINWGISEIVEDTKNEQDQGTPEQSKDGTPRTG